MEEILCYYSARFQEDDCIHSVVVVNPFYGLEGNYGYEVRVDGRQVDFAFSQGEAYRVVLELLDKLSIESITKYF